MPQEVLKKEKFFRAKITKHNNTLKVVIAGGSLAIVVAGLSLLGYQSWKYWRKVEEKQKEEVHIGPEKNTLPPEEEDSSFVDDVDREKVSPVQGKNSSSPLKRHRAYTKLPKHHNLSNIDEQKDKQVEHSPLHPKDEAKEEKTDKKYPSTLSSKNSMNQEEEEINLRKAIREVAKKSKETLQQERENAKSSYDKNLYDFALEAKAFKKPLSEDKSDKSYANAVQVLALEWLLKRADKKRTDIDEKTNIKKTKDRSSIKLPENFKKAQEEYNNIKEKLDIATKKYDKDFGIENDQN